jgi:hypothetical protein
VKRVAAVLAACGAPHAAATVDNRGAPYCDLPVRITGDALLVRDDPTPEIVRHVRWQRGSSERAQRQ